MIPVQATIVAFGTIANGTPVGLHSEWGVPAISPGTTQEAALTAAAGGVLLSGQPSDGDTVTISDGIYSVVFEFDSNASITAGRVAVTIGGSAAATMTALLVAIGTSGLLLSWTAGVPSTTQTNFTTTSPDILANTTWTKSGANITVAGLTGGTLGTIYRAWRQLWIENDTDARLDVGILHNVTSVLGTPLIANAAKYRIISLKQGDKFCWTLHDKDRLAGPIYLRGTTADPTTGNAYLGGFAE